MTFEYLSHCLPRSVTKLYKFDRLRRKRLLCYYYIEVKPMVASQKLRVLKPLFSSLLQNKQASKMFALH